MTLSGCGGGASTEPTVTIKPTESKESATGGGTKTADSGDEEAVSEEGFGTVKGFVLYEGAAPDLGPVVTQGQIKPDDAAVCIAPNIPNEKLVINGGGIENVFIYLDKVPKGIEVPAVPTEPAVFDQKGCVFLQHGFLVRAGQQVLVKSDDPIAHNTHTFPERNSGFNSTIAPNDRDGVPLVYNRPEKSPFEVKCDLHTWMRAYHMVIDHPWGAVSGNDGSFEIVDMPAGKHKLRVWHESANGGFLSRDYEVTVKPGETTEVKLAYNASNFSL